MLRIVNYAYPNPGALMDKTQFKYNKVSIHLLEDYFNMLSAVFCAEYFVGAMEQETVHIMEYEVDGNEVLMPTRYGWAGDINNLVQEVFKGCIVDESPINEIINNIIYARYDVLCTNEKAMCEAYQPLGDPEYEPEIPVPENSLVILYYVDEDEAIDLALKNKYIEPVTVMIATDRHAEIRSIAVSSTVNHALLMLSSDHEVLTGSPVGSGRGFFAFETPPGTIDESINTYLENLFMKDAVFLGAMIIDKKKLDTMLLKPYKPDKLLEKLIGRNYIEPPPTMIL